jgi:hypothetical protein
MRNELGSIWKSDGPSKAAHGNRMNASHRDGRQDRLGDLIAAGWDLIIYDEAHRLGGNTDPVARYRLARAVAEGAPYLLTNPGRSPNR